MSNTHRNKHRLDTTTTATTYDHLTDLISVDKNDLVNVEWKQHVEEENLVSTAHDVSVKLLTLSTGIKQY